MRQVSSAIIAIIITALLKIRGRAAILCANDVSLCLQKEQHGSGITEKP